jgi:hypothetical protein
VTLYLYSTKIESWKQVFISHLVCFWVPSEKIFTNTVMQGKKQSNAKKNRKSGTFRWLPDRPCFMASQPWTNSKVALISLESVWWHWIMLYWSVSHGNNLKLLKFSIFEVFSYYPCLYFIHDHHVLNIKTLFNVTYLVENHASLHCSWILNPTL